MRRHAVTMLAGAAALLCGPDAATAAEGAAPFAIDMPLRAEEAAHSALGLWPFGAHGADHAVDGHPGWDVEVVPGASARAAADGQVLSARDDSHSPGRFTVQLSHRSGTAFYRTVYTNLTDLAPAIREGALVLAGDPLGVVGVQQRKVGPREATWAAFHFQVDDFSQSSGITNLNAVGPEPWLSSAGRETFAAIWRTAAWAGELVEPFPANPRDAPFPQTRVWTRTAGDLAASLSFSRSDGAAT